MKLVQTYNRKLAESIWWNLLWLTIGALLVTICIQSVATPHNFVAGGILGMAYLVWHWTGTLDLLLWYLLLSVPIWVWGWFFAAILHLTEQRFSPSGFPKDGAFP